MRIKSNTRVEIGRLFACLEYGEKIAHDCALRQAAMPGPETSNRFFIRQARQEQAHAKVFGRVILCLTPRGPRQVPPALRQVRANLERACRRGDLVETLVGQQIVLEGFGELVLRRMDKKFDQYKLGFARARKTLLHQERGHHAFGERILKEMLGSGSVSSERVCEIFEEYMYLIEQVINDAQPMFDVMGADAGLYKAELRATTTAWVTAP